MKTQSIDENTATMTQLQAEIRRCRQIDTELRESKAHFLGLFENTADAIFIVDTMGTIVEANPAAVRLHTAEPNALLQKNIVDLAPGTWKTAATRALAELVEDKAVSSFATIDHAGTYTYLFRTQDVDIRQHVERTLQRRNRDLSLLNQASRVLNSTLDLDKLLAAILDQVPQLMGAMASSIWLIDNRTKELVCKQSTEPGVLKGWRMPSNQGIVGWTITHGESLLVPDTRKDMRHYKAVDQKSGKEVRSILSVPLSVKQRAIGALQLVDPQPDRFYEEDIPIMESLAATAAIAIENAQLFEQVQEDAETKAMLVHEINHRVKNNLASIIGLLYSEQRYARTEDPESYRTLLRDLIGRIQGMAQVHAMLSAAEWLPLPLDELTYRMATMALQLLPERVNVAVDVTPTSINVPPKQATNLALIINELTTNTIKYALDDRTAAKITVRILPEPNDMVRFEFHNDGADYPEEVLTGEHRNLGLYLVQTLVERGLGGTLELHNDHGPVTVIHFQRE